MDVTFKTLDKQKFNISVDSNDTVEDLVFKLGNKIGNENLYRLIYAGKLLKEGTLVSDYNVSPKLPVIVMVTKPSQQLVDNASIEKMELIRRDNEKTVKYKKIRTESEDSGFVPDEDISNHFVTEKEFIIALEVMTCEFLVDPHKRPHTE